MALLLYGQFWKPAHEPGLREFAQRIPEECVLTRATMDQVLARIAPDDQWRMFRDDQIVEVAPPPAPGWSHDYEAWPSRLSAEMMIRQPSVAEVQRLHPERARQREQVGAVTLEGRVREDGSLTWRVLEATPYGWGFENAALRVAALYEAPIQFEDGRTTVGAPFVTVIVFDAPAPRRVMYH